MVKISHFSKNIGYFYPLIAFHIKEGFYVIPDSDNLESEPSDIKECDFSFTAFNDKQLDELLNIYPFDVPTKPSFLERLFRG